MDRRILFVSPHHDHAAALAQMLEPALIGIQSVTSCHDASRYLAQGAYSAILTEAFLPDGNWKDVFELACCLEPSPAVLVTHRNADDSFWAEILNFGCYDLLAQPFDTREVQRILSLACRQVAEKPASPKPVERAGSVKRTLSATG